MARAAVAASYPLMRLSGFARMQAGHQGATLSLWLLPPASVLTDSPPLPTPSLPAPGGPLLPAPPQVSQPGSLLLSSPSQHPEFETGSSQIPGPRRLNANSLGAKNAHTPEVLDRGAGPPNPDATGWGDSGIPALQSPGVTDACASPVLRCKDARPERFRNPSGNFGPGIPPSPTPPHPQLILGSPVPCVPRGSHRHNATSREVGGRRRCNYSLSFLHSTGSSELGPRGP